MLQFLKGRAVVRPRALTGNAVANLWQPFTEANPPGVQVIVTVYNCAPYLDRFLESLERAMKGYRWVFLAADDGSTDGSYERLQEYADGSVADECVVKRFEKAANVSVAKNRAVRFGFPFREEYPAVMLCDADDEVGAYRVKGLLTAALKGGYVSLAGDFERERDGARVYHAASELTYGPPMTLFHEALIPWDGTLFDESFRNHGDWAQQAEWRARGIHTEIVPGFVTNVHVYHADSVSNSLTPAQTKERREKLERYREALQTRVLLSFCTTCMGRLEHLKQTLLHNLELCREMKDVEFTLANYNSRDGLDEWVKSRLGADLASGRLRYAHTTEPAEFQHGRAKNMAHDLGTGLYLVNVDADNFLTREYIEGLRREIATGAELVHFPGGQYSWGGGYGRVALKRDLFEAVGGYDEAHLGWGGDDWDLVLRAAAMSRRPVRMMDAKCLRFLEHDDEVRLQNISQKDKGASNEAWKKYFAERVERGELVANGGRRRNKKENTL